MPTIEHELSVEMVRNRPEIVPELLKHLGCPLPDAVDVEVLSTDFTDIKPTEYRADVTVKVTTAGDSANAIIVEVQNRADERKQFSWPVYVTTLHARLKIPVFLLVMCPNARVARACRKPVVIGARWFMTMSPIVLDMTNVPKVTDDALAERLPELAVMSAIAYGGQPGSEAVLRACVAGFKNVDPDHLDLYYDVVRKSLPSARRGFFGGLMSILETYRPVSDWGRRHFRNGEAKGKAEGKVQGEAEALLTVLSARDFDVSDDVRARINGCADPEQLNAWIRRAVTIDRVDELFD